MKLPVFVTLSLLAALPVTSCKKTAPESPVPTAAIEIPVDWSGCSQTPPGMTIILYGEEGTAVQTKTTSRTGGVTFRLRPGTYRALAFSYSPGEWRSLLLRGLDKWETARIEPTDQEPSVLSYGSGEPFVISDSDAAASRTIRTAVIRPEDVVHNLQITIYLDGIRHLGSISGSLSPTHIKPFDTMHNIMPLFSGERLIPLPEADWDLSGPATITRNILDPVTDLRELQLRFCYPGGRAALDTLISLEGNIAALPSGNYHIRIGAGPDGRIVIPPSGESPDSPFITDIIDWEPGEESEYLLQ